MTSILSEPSPRARALRLLQHHGDNNLGYVGLGPEGSLFFSSDEGGYIAYREMAGFALALGHPVAPPSTWDRLLGEFRDFCARRRRGIAFCGVARDALPFFSERGFSHLKVGDEALVDLPPFSTVGRRGDEFRLALNRARRRQVRFEWVEPEARTPEVLAEVRDVSRRWLAQRPYPELEFAMGTIETIRDPTIRLGIARRVNGEVGGFVTWLPIFGANGWLLDLMRRRSDSMPRLMDFLITRSLLSFQQEGCAVASLGGNPFSNVDHERGGMARRLLDLTYQHLGVGYGFKSLVHYKAKFHPHWEPLYLVCAPGSSLLRASYAVGRAVAPKARPHHLGNALSRILIAKLRG